jgi:hypothetical protein
MHLGLAALLSTAGAVLFSSTMSDFKGVSDPLYIDNGVIRLGINPRYGGSISYFAYSPNPDQNYINCHDLGREIQMSFYSGPVNYCPPNPGWKNWYICHVLK